MDRQLVDQFIATGRVVRLEMGPGEAWILIGSLQLGLRTGLEGWQYRRVRELCDRVIDVLPTEELRDLARRGYTE